MRFIVRRGDEAVARADATLLAAMGLPGGGVVRLGRTHTRVVPGEVPSPNTLVVDETTLTNAGLAPGSSVDVTRAVLPAARRATLDDGADRELARLLRGRPLTEGDRLASPSGVVSVVRVEPPPAAIVGDQTVFETRSGARRAPAAPPTAPPTTSEAMLVGLETELETLTGWLRLLAGSDDLPSSWGLPRAAGIVVEGPVGCGKSALTAAAAAAAGVRFHRLELDVVFRPERLLALLERALGQVVGPTALYLDRVDVVAGEDAAHRNQVAAIFRWFLDAVAERPRLAAVVATASAARLVPGVATSPLLPRILRIPPPDRARRRALFEAALARTPARDVDLDRLAALSAGFSAADVLAAVLHAGAMVAATAAGTLTADVLERAVAETSPSLGATALGEVPGYGFERVADLTEVKARLTESVLWPLREPERFRRLGIEPPKGLLLHGPPGTGKTFVVRALAHEAGAAFFPVKGAELLDKWVGESERAVRELFARARAVAPALLFFDEIDALAPVRGRSSTTVTDSVVAALLTELDGVAARGDLFVIGATNRRDLVDPALLRPGRLEVHLRLGLPATEARRAFFEISDIPFADGVDLDELTRATDGASFADLAGLLREAALTALRRDPTAMSVTEADLRAALASRG